MANDAIDPIDQLLKDTAPGGPQKTEQSAGSPPTTFFQRFKGNLAREGPGLLGMAVAGALPVTRPLLGPLARMVTGGVAAGGGRLTAGGSLEEAKKEAGVFAGTQGAAETGFGLFRLGLGQQRAGKALREADTAFTAAQKQHLDLKAQLEATFKAASQAHAEKGAASIANAYMDSVPAWKGKFPANETGIADMTTGQGQQLLGQSFDKSMKALVSEAKGIKVLIRAEDAAKLRLEPTEVLKPDPGQGEAISRVFVKADELAQAGIGVWKKDPGLYHRIFEALDQHGLGNQAAREEYRTGQSLINFTDKSGMMKTGQFDPEKARLGLYNLKAVDTLRKRGEGDVFRGPIAEAVQTGAPTTPVIPSEPVKPDLGITKKEIGPMTKFHLGGGAGMAASALSGGGIHGGWPYIGGGILAEHLLPQMSRYTGAGVPKPSVPPMLPAVLGELMRRLGVALPGDQTQEPPRYVPAAP